MYNYAKQKQGWVTFKDNRPKVKLRKYISGIASQVSRIQNSKLTTTKDFLIKMYNEGGIQKVTTSAMVLVNESKQDIPND